MSNQSVPYTALSDEHQVAVPIAAASHLSYGHPLAVPAVPAAQPPHAVSHSQPYSNSSYQSDMESYDRLAGPQSANASAFPSQSIPVLNPPDHESVLLTVETYARAPEPREPVYKSQYTFHAVSAVLNVVTIGLFIGLLVSLPMYPNQSTGTTDSVTGLNWTPMGLLIGFLVCYAIYLGNIMYSGTLKFLRNIVTESEFEEFLSRMARVDHEQTPVLRVNIECFHYETRTDSSFSQDADGNWQSNNSTTVDRVVTYTTTETFPTPNSNCWSDESDVMSYATSGVTRINCSALLGFGSPAATMAVLGFKQRVVNANRFRDKYIKAVDFLEVPNFKQNFLAVSPGYRLSALMNTGAFALSTALLLSWPYRMWFDKRSKRMSLVVRKKLTL